jgi:hypothetical protein
VTHSPVAINLGNIRLGGHPFQLFFAILRNIRLGAQRFHLFHFYHIFLAADTISLPVNHFPLPVFASSTQLHTYNLD